MKLILLIMSILLLYTDYVAAKAPIKVKVTFYNATKSQCDSTPNETAFGCKPKINRTVAISRSLKKKIKPKSRIHIEGIGIRYVEDLMSKKIKGDQIDVLIKNRKEAIKLGKIESKIHILD